MDESSLETRLKIIALAWACTLTPPTCYVIPEPEPPYGLFRYYLPDLVTLERLLNAESRNSKIMSSFLR